MGRLSDASALPTRVGGEGQKFLRLYLEVFDDEDREVFRSCVEKHGTSEAHRRINRDFPEFPIGRSSVERGTALLKAVTWDASKIDH